MKHFNRRAISVALLITLGAAFSVNAQAAETSSIENSITEMVVAQGQQVMSNLAVQLQQSITEELNNFSVDLSLDESITESIAWLTDEATTNDTNVNESGEKAAKNSTANIKLLD